MSGQTRHLLLVGMMGSGKSTAGRELAQRLGRRFVDLDEEIAARAGRSIPEIFAAEGEAGFRRRERDSLAVVLSDPVPAVIATGGGAVLDPENRAVMREEAVTIWLRAEPAALASRVGTGSGRPMLGDDPLSDLRRLAGEREPLYREVADVVIAVDSLDPAGFVEAVLVVLDEEDPSE